MAVWLRNGRRPVYTPEYNKYLRWKGAEHTGGACPPHEKWRCEDEKAARVLVYRMLMKYERGPGRPRKDDGAMANEGRQRPSARSDDGSSEGGQ